MTAQARSFDYAVMLDEAWDARSDRGGPSLSGSDGQTWTPEHLVLASVVRCSLTSLRHHCRRAGIAITSSGSATGTITRREEDGRFAFVSIDVAADVALDPKPDAAALSELLAKAERDCFVGASLTAAPVYDWRIA